MELRLQNRARPGDTLERSSGRAAPGRGVPLPLHRAVGRYAAGSGSSQSGERRCRTWPSGARHHRRRLPQQSGRGLRRPPRAGQPSLEPRPDARVPLPAGDGCPAASHGLGRLVLLRPVPGRIRSRRPDTAGLFPGCPVVQLTTQAGVRAGRKNLPNERKMMRPAPPASHRHGQVRPDIGIGIVND